MNVSKTPPGDIANTRFLERRKRKREREREKEPKPKPTRAKKWQKFNRPQVGPDNSDVTKVKFIPIPFSFVKSWDKKGSSFSIFSYHEGSWRKFTQNVA